MSSQSTVGNGQSWRWALASGLLMLLLACAAFALPLLEGMQRGRMIGWLLVVAGLAELLFGLKRGFDPAGIAAIGSGLLTAIAGLMFLFNPLYGFLSIANVVLAWLVVRGVWIVVTALRVERPPIRRWLIYSGATDLLLGAALLVGLHVSTLVVLLFGPTPAIVAQFALIFAASFLVTGLSQVATGLIQRPGSRPG